MNGVVPAYMAGVAQGAFNMRLLLGYDAGVSLSADERKELRESLTAALIAGAKKSGSKLPMGNWSERDFVYHHARMVAGN